MAARGPVRSVIFLVEFLFASTKLRGAFGAGAPSARHGKGHPSRGGTAVSELPNDRRVQVSTANEERDSRTGGCRNPMGPVSVPVDPTGGNVQ